MMIATTMHPTDGALGDSSEPGVLELDVRGEIAPLDYLQMFRALKEAYVCRGPLRVLLDMGGYGRAELSVIVRKISHGFSPKSGQIDRIALIGDQTFLSAYLQHASHLAPIQTESFSADERGLAIDWLRA